MHAIRSTTSKPRAASASDRFLGHARRIAGLTLISRFAGLARDAVCARVFGAVAIWSAFAVAFLIPNLFRRLFGEGALAAAFIPIYAQLLDNDKAGARRFARATFTLVFIALAVATLLGEAILLALLFLTPLGDSGGLALRLAITLLPFMPLVCITAIVGGALQTHSVFTPTAAAPIILNVCIISGALAGSIGFGLSPRVNIFIVSIAVLVAGTVQLLWSTTALARSAGISLAPLRPAGAQRDLRRLAKNAGPAILGLGVLQLNTLFDGLIASWPVLVGATIALPIFGTTTYPLDEVSNATLFYAIRLYQFPLGVIGVSLATAVFPTLARLARDQRAFASTLRNGLRLAIFIGVPASVGLALVREPLVATIFEGGRFGDASRARVATTLLGYCPAVVAAMLAQTLTRAYYAKGDTRTPMRVALLAVALNLALNVSLVWSLREAGLAWATSASAMAQVAALATLARRRTGVRVIDSLLFKTGLNAAIGAALMAGAVMLAMRLSRAALASVWLETTWAFHAATLMTSVGAGGAAFVLASWILHAEELRWLVGKKTASQEDRNQEADSSEGAFD